MKKNSVFLGGLALMLLSGCAFSNNVSVKKDVFKFNYGERIQKNVRKFLKGKDEYLQKSKIDFSVLDKDQYGNVKAGNYKVPVDTDGEKDTISIKVVDNVKPVIENKPEYEIEQGSKESSLTSSIIAYDKVNDIKIPLKVKIVNKNKLNLDKVGIYKVSVEAKDKNGNVTKKVVKVNVIAKQEKLICRQTQDVGDVSMDYEYNVEKNRIVSERIVLYLNRKNAMYYYLATNDEMKAQFASSLKDYLGLDEKTNLNINYKYDSETITVTIDINQDQLQQIYGIDFKNSKYSTIKKDLHKSNIHTCGEEK